MAIPQEQPNPARSQPRLSRDEERIAQAVVAALSPRYDNMIEQLKAMNALILANHDDIKYVRIN